ncbi:immunity 26/phosphotriesterase HocA family protein [Shewanella sp. C32]|uniref:Immunity 26/phosphotriesterase HocA family protein n=1 Tax=Shewanella electrica TaxID=515560 RepID=A0ABT2FTB9_9GAMM|nr:Imm26 family immunity protein [Shewanella electrica]MCH1925752.1 immunity 26/phosphotriesterase HocA family protein [Shewanella electrica]MCS4558421.1 immunity 26/phosphotriesterase HocA family protein [Shewanella electrica]
MSKKYNEGDIFVIPMNNEKFAICQIVCAFKGRFKKAFSFGVIGIQSDSSMPNDSEFLTFKNSRGEFDIIFSSSENIKNGDWIIIGNIPITQKKEALKIYQSAGNLYRCDEHIRVLNKEEYKSFNVMGIAGYELVHQYLAQH